jgi:hypothetical protein
MKLTVKTLQQQQYIVEVNENDTVSFFKLFAKFHGVYHSESALANVIFRLQQSKAK